MASTKEQIISACETLLENNGKAPNQSQVRELLGGGSYTTISPVLTQWKKERTETKLQPHNSTTPDSVKDVAATAINKIWQVAEQLAEERLASEREVLKAAQDEAANKTKDLELFISSLEHDLKTIEAALKDSKNENSELRDKYEKAKTTISELTVEKSSFVVKLENFDNLKQENSVTTKSLAEKEKELAVITTETQNKNKQINYIENQLKEVTVETNENIRMLTSELIAEKSNAKNTDNELKAVSQKLFTAQNKIATLEERTKRVDALDEQTQKMTTETVELKAALMSTTKALDEATKALEKDKKKETN